MVWAAAALVVAVLGFVVAPRVAFAVAMRREPRGRHWMLWAAAALFVVSWLLPNPDLAYTKTFTQHAVGGGAACALAAAWFTHNARVRPAALRVAVAYATTAALGTGVEMAELVYDELTGAGLTLDAAWDLLANTTGALATAVLIELVEAVRATAAARRLPQRSTADERAPLVGREGFEPP